MVHVKWKGRVFLDFDQFLWNFRFCYQILFFYLHKFNATFKKKIFIIIMWLETQVLSKLQQYIIRHQISKWEYNTTHIYEFKYIIAWPYFFSRAIIWSAMKNDIYARFITLKYRIQGEKWPKWRKVDVMRSIYGLLFALFFVLHSIAFAIVSMQIKYILIVFVCFL